MSEEHEWNGLRVRRDERGKWQYGCGREWEWLPFSESRPSRAVVAELDKLYPPPRTVTLDNGETFFKDGEIWFDEAGKSEPVYLTPLLDTIDRYQNGDADDDA